MVCCAVYVSKIQGCLIKATERADLNSPLTIAYLDAKRQVQMEVGRLQRFTLSGLAEVLQQWWSY